MKTLRKQLDKFCNDWGLDKTQWGKEHPDELETFKDNLIDLFLKNLKDLLK